MMADVMRRAALLMLLSLFGCHTNSDVVWTNPGDPGAPTITEVRGAICPGGFDELMGFESSNFIGNPSHELFDWQWKQLRLDTTYDPDARLPADAVDTGYRQGDRELWKSADPGRDAVFIVSPEMVQKWPRFDLGCA